MRNVVKPLKGKTMNQFIPKLFDVMKGYSKKQFVNDVIAGIIVAIIALPLSIALALASGVGPEQGIYTAIFAGFVISLKVTLQIASFGIPNKYAKCHAIASPSRSGSVAR